jgi:hypothetical protein
MAQRLIAHGVLWAMLAGMVAPLAPALAMPHACCLRRGQHCHMPQEAGVSSRNCCHRCCRFLAVSRALFTPVAAPGRASLPVSRLILLPRPASQTWHAPAERPPRAPPAVL